MNRCKATGCDSYALNDSPETGYCDVCLYKIPLMELLARVHVDDGQYTQKHGLQKSVIDAYKIIAKAIANNN